MKQCNQCQVKMFDGAKGCGICGSNDVTQLTPIRKPKRERKFSPKIKKETNEEYDVSQGSKYLGSGVRQVGAMSFEVTSKSGNKKYEINLNKMRDHKGDCMGYRYKQDCNHLERLRECGIKV